MTDDRIVEPRLLRGFRDYLPGQMNAKLAIIAAIRRVYESYGFLPLDTPALEYHETLMGYGEDNAKQIFEFENPEEEHVALRFDLTAPLARVVAQYTDLPLPFRRYQVGPVWRADKPDPGRFREFTQFDLDSVGTPSSAADTEILCGVYDTLRALGIPRFRVRFSDRNVLNTLLDFAGIPHSSSRPVFRILDKLDKIGLDGIVAELSGGRVDASGDKIRGLGLGTGPIDKIKQFIAVPRGTRTEVLGELKRLFGEVPSATGALQGLGAICSSLDALGIPDEFVALDQSIARGLDYYTGPVFEALLTDALEFGSVVGGGRYDGLVARFLGRSIPAVGASIGVDRLLAAMTKLGLTGTAPSTAQVLVTVMEPGKIIEYEKLTREFRQAGVNAELYLGEEKGLSKQLAYANRQQIPLAVLVGSDEFQKGEVTIKNLKLGAQLPDKKTQREEWLKLSRTVQFAVPRGECVSHVRRIIAEL
jgi:histidyl-tRNA synthetase